jgi:hypothetical protein
LTCKSYPKQVRYPTEQAAFRALLRRLRETNGLRVFACSTCGGFHLTSRPLGRDQ